MILTLTDSPEIVELKKEFRELDAQEQTLKHLQCEEIETPAMVQVRARKREIAMQIFYKENP
jgi:hypothetical protein